jgi:hypothetical protein
VSTTYPAGVVDDRFPPVKITNRGGDVKIGDFGIAGGFPAYIIEHGIEVTPGDNTKVSTLTLTFIVGDVEVDDDCHKHVKVNPLASES